MQSVQSSQKCPKTIDLTNTSISNSQVLENMFVRLLNASQADHYYERLEDQPRGSLLHEKLEIIKEGLLYTSMRTASKTYGSADGVAAQIEQGASIRINGHQDPYYLGIISVTSPRNRPFQILASSPYEIEEGVLAYLVRGKLNESSDDRTLMVEPILDRTVFACELRRFCSIAMPGERETSLENTIIGLKMLKVLEKQISNLDSGNSSIQKRGTASAFQGKEIISQTDSAIVAALEHGNYSFRVSAVYNQCNMTISGRLLQHTSLR